MLEDTVLAWIPPKEEPETRHNKRFRKQNYMGIRKGYGKIMSNDENINWTSSSKKAHPIHQG